MNIDDKLTLQNCEEALVLVQKQLQSGKDLHLAFNQLGAIYGILKQYAKAEEYFKQAISLKPNFAAPYLNLGIIYNTQTEYVKSAEYFEKALQMDDNNSNVHYNYAIALQENGEINKAIEYYKTAIKFDPNRADAHFNKGLLDLLTGNFTEGWKEYEDWGYLSGDRIKREIKGKLWKGESYIGKTLYVFSDQGFGDAINYFRYLPYIKKLGGKLIFECPANLYNLFENNNSCFDELTTPEKGDKFIPDFQIPLTSIPALFHLNNMEIKTDFPYLKVKETKENYWKNVIHNNNNLKIGFLWKGNPYPPINKKRHAKLEDFYPLFEAPDTDWYSFLFEDDTELKNCVYKNVFDFTKEIKDFEDTAAILNNLDMVVTIDSGLAHLAGALNKNVLLLVPFVPDWRWGLKTDKTVWYPSIKIFRQNSSKTWFNVINEINRYLRDIISK